MIPYVLVIIKPYSSLTSVDHLIWNYLVAEDDYFNQLFKVPPYGTSFLFLSKMHDYQTEYFFNVSVYI